MSAEYKKEWERYRGLAKAAAGGDKNAHAEKARAMNNIRAMERDGARSGNILSATYRGDQVVVSTTKTRSKESSQEEYVHKFDKDAKVIIDGKERNLQEFHSKRLLGR